MCGRAREFRWTHEEVCLQHWSLKGHVLLLEFFFFFPRMPNVEDFELIVRSRSCLLSIWNFLFFRWSFQILLIQYKVTFVHCNGYSHYDCIVESFGRSSKDSYLPLKTYFLITITKDHFSVSVSKNCIFKK